MSTPEHDVEYRLDADHIRAVGYLTRIPDNSDMIVVTGWSTTQLDIRAAALTGLLARWRDTLTDTAARAVDIYALTHQRWTPPGAHHYAVNTALFIQEHEAKLLTGPHAAHDPHIRPHDDDQARLLTDNQRLEQAVAHHLDRARRVAAYAIDAYIHDLNAQAEPADARAWAITTAMNRYSAEGRGNAGLCTTPPAPIPRVPGTRDHPAPVAANDQPTRTPTGESAEPTPPAPATAADTPSTANAVSPTGTASPPRRRTP